MIYTNYKATELKSVNLLHFVEQNSKLLDCTGILFEVSCSRGAFLSLKTKQISRWPWRCYLKYFMQWREKLVQDSLSRIVLCLSISSIFCSETGTQWTPASISSQHWVHSIPAIFRFKWNQRYLQCLSQKGNKYFRSSNILVMTWVQWEGCFEWTLRADTRKMEHQFLLHCLSKLKIETLQCVIKQIFTPWFLEANLRPSFQQQN